MSRYASLLALIVLPTVLASCQTARYKEFELIHGGMTKGEVLAAVGGPNRTQRWHGRDRWEYTLYGHPDGDVVREVHFEQGKSTYIGAAIKPAVTADEQDRINLMYNQTADLRDREASKLSKDGITVQRFRAVEDTDAAAPSTAK